MSRRGRSGPTISLFSFQDIITSVTAIVTVITLLLALDLVQRKQSKAGDSPEGIAVELAKRLLRVETELTDLQKLADRTDTIVKEAAERSPAQLISDIEMLRASIAELERERSLLKDAVDDWKSRERDAMTEQFDLQSAKEELAKIELKADEIERQVKSERAENRPVFTLPRGFKKNGWLAIVEAKRVSIAPLNRAAKPVVISAAEPSLFAPSLTNRFLKWIVDEGAVGDYFLLIVRPEGAKSFSEIQTELDKKSISHGFDVADSHQSLLDPERGASH